MSLPSHQLNAGRLAKRAQLAATRPSVTRIARCRSRPGCRSGTGPATACPCPPRPCLCRMTFAGQVCRPWGHHVLRDDKGSARGRSRGAAARKSSSAPRHLHGRQTMTRRRLRLRRPSRLPLVALCAAGMSNLRRASAAACRSPPPPGAFPRHARPDRQHAHAKRAVHQRHQQRRGDGAPVAAAAGRRRRHRRPTVDQPAGADVRRVAAEQPHRHPRAR